MDLPKAYDPKEYEDKIYRDWESRGLFNPDNLKPRSKKHFSIVLPPPNVTGTLHLGHASMLAIEDLMIRYNRMKGLDTVWIPGTDHAAIATQNIVEKKLLREEKKTRHDLGRVEFLKKVDEYVKQSKETIHHQLRKMGSSMDWSREAYTLDETRNRAVRKVFKMMHDDGLIYRGHRIVNWCPRCHSTLADDEIVYKETAGKVYTFKYDKDFPLSIATTRPETKLGDTAVAVNPKDKRYKKFIGKEYAADFCGVKLKIKIIADSQIETGFGTGALGVTPAHSFVDYEMAQRNGLPVIKVIDEDAKMTAAAGSYRGLHVEAAREAVVAELRKKRLLEKEEELKHNLSLCYRCKTAIEPLPSDQWFVNVNQKSKIKSQKLKKIVGKSEASLKEIALAAVKKGAIKIIPERFEKTYFQWMENLHDWCVSRQIWFGHRIPVWYREGRGAEIVMMRHGEAMSNKLNKLNSDVNNQLNGLTELGRDQVEKAMAMLKKEKFSAIIASDFKRTRETAAIAAKILKLPVIHDIRLREVGVGEFEGKTDKEMIAFRNKVGFNGWLHDSPKGIEPFADLRARVFSVLEEINKKYAGQKVLVVAHGDVIRAAQGFGKKLTDEEIFRFSYPDVAGHIRMVLPGKIEIKVSENGVAGSDWRQDEDTLDTWFSSGLWTFTSLLPKDWDAKKFAGNDLKRFHPTSVLETGYDILFFWVARMILMTTYVLGDVPFTTVYLHGLIRDKEGDKMSKSKPETAIDPVAAGEKYGFDAVRLSLLIGNTAGNDIQLYDEKIEGYRNFVNKLWNISRYIILNSEQAANNKFQTSKLTLSDKWILSEFNRLKESVSEELDGYNFSAAGELLREFTWGDLADWYLEIAKIEQNKGQILFSILKDLLKMWHPFVPFVTTAIWQSMAETGDLMIKEWPSADKKFIDEAVEKEFSLVREIIVKIRNLRAEYRVDPAKKITVAIKGKNISEYGQIIKYLARLEKIDYVAANPGQAATATTGSTEIYLPLSGLVDTAAEKERLVKEKSNLENYISALEKKLTNAEFVKNAPDAVVLGERGKLASAKEKSAKITRQLTELK